VTAGIVNLMMMIVMRRRSTTTVIEPHDRNADHENERQDPA
jgi:hypothetical protein